MMIETIPASKPTANAMSTPADPNPFKPEIEAISKSVSELKDNIAQILTSLDKVVQANENHTREIKQLQKDSDNKRLGVGILSLILVAILAGCVLRTQINSFQATVLCVVTASVTILGVAVVVGTSRCREDD